MNEIIQAVDSVPMRTIAQLVLDVIGSGAAAALLTQMLKAHPSVPLEEGDKTKIRIVAAALSTAGVLLTSISQGIVNQADVQALLVVVIGGPLAWWLSHHAYKATKE